MRLLTFLFIILSISHSFAAPKNDMFGQSVSDGKLAEMNNYINSANFNKNYQNLMNSKSFSMGVERGSADVNVYQKRAIGVAAIATEEGMGSGAVITNKFHIVTNYHVVGNYKQVAVAFKRLDDGPIEDSDVKIGYVIKVDEVSDLALIQVDPSVVPRYVKPIPLSKGNPPVGSDAHAIGHPSGQLWTYTKGYISQVRKNFKWNEIHDADVLQVQTPINPGNSGGPLLDSKGDLIGINTFKDPQNENMNFAVALANINTFLSRDGDRMAAKKQEKDCPVIEGGSEYVNDPEFGRVLVKKYSGRCDKKIDFIILIPDNPTFAVYAFLDSNGDQNPDVVTIDQNRDGVVEITEYDRNYDGIYDVRGYHTSGDNANPDRFEKIS